MLAPLPFIPFSSSAAEIPLSSSAAESAGLLAVVLLCCIATPLCVSLTKVGVVLFCCIAALLSAHRRYQCSITSWVA